jgi:hypothetical protein
VVLQVTLWGAASGAIFARGYPSLGPEAAAVIFAAAGILVRRRKRLAGDASRG